MQRGIIPERLPSSINGLNSMIDYINKFHDTSKLTILEIGSWTGCSMEVFAKRFKKVFCVDPWESTKEINTQYDMKQVESCFDFRVKRFNNVEKLKGTSENIVKIMTGKSFDVIYIDGLHFYEAVLQDILLWQDKAKLYISGHDYNNKFSGVVKAVNEYFIKPDKIFSDSSWIKAVKS